MKTKPLEVSRGDRMPNEWIPMAALLVAVPLGGLIFSGHGIAALVISFIFASLALARMQARHARVQRSRVDAASAPPSPPPRRVRIKALPSRDDRALEDSPPDAHAEATERASMRRR